MLYVHDITLERDVPIAAFIDLNCKQMHSDSRPRSVANCSWHRHYFIDTISGHVFEFNGTLAGQLFRRDIFVTISPEQKY